MAREGSDHVKAACYAVGVALILIGFGGLFTHAADTHPAGWALWFLAALFVHDFVLVPAVLAGAALIARLPAAYRTPLQVAAVLGGCLGVVALPVVLGFGKDPGNPSQLPLAYGRNLLIVLSIIAVGTAVIVVRRVRTARHKAPGADVRIGDSD
jgi:hypothetical protein